MTSFELFLASGEYTPRVFISVMYDPSLDYFSTTEVRQSNV